MHCLPVFVRFTPEVGSADMPALRLPRGTLRGMRAGDAAGGRRRPPSPTDASL